MKFSNGTRFIKSWVSNPIFFPFEKCVFSHFFPLFPMGKKYMERDGKEYFSLSFHIFFPMGKSGKNTFFPWEKMGLDSQS